MKNSLRKNLIAILTALFAVMLAFSALTASFSAKADVTPVELADAVITMHDGASIKTSGNMGILDNGLKAIENSDLSLGEKYRQSKRVKRVLLSPLRMITKNSEYYFGDKQTEYDTRFTALVSELGHIMSRKPHKIIEANVPNYKIMVDEEDAKSVECAHYLNEWFKNKTGVTLEIIGHHDAYPTYAEKVICLGPNDFAKEFFQRTDFSKYNIFVKSCGAALFIAGKSLKEGCNIFIDTLKEKTWCANVTGRYSSLKMEMLELVEYR